MGMLQVCGDLDLFEKPFRIEGGGQLGPQHLDRDLAMVFEVLGEVDHCHAARTQLTLDSVAVAEGGFQSFEGVRHRSIRCDFRYDPPRFDEFGALLGPLRKKKGRSKERPAKPRKHCNAIVYFDTPPWSRTPNLLIKRQVKSGMKLWQLAVEQRVRVVRCQT